MINCNTSSLRRHKASIPCFVMLSKNYVIKKARSRNIMGSTSLVYSKKVNLKIPVRLSFQCLPLFLGKEKSGKCTYFATDHCFIHPPLILNTQMLITSLQHIKPCISLHNQSLWTLCIIYCHEKSSINVESYFADMIIKTLILSTLKQWFLCCRFLRC